jgi:hypothetical protein
MIVSLHTTAQDCIQLHFEFFLRFLPLSKVPLYRFGEGHFEEYFDMELTWT